MAIRRCQSETGGGRQGPWSAIVFGNCASKSNSRQWFGPGMLVKSKRALAFTELFNIQTKPLSPMFEGDLHIELSIYYDSRRPDLDESLILDLLQGVAYKNDRQIKSKRVRWGLDRNNPRVEITIRPIEEGDYAPA